MEGQSENVSDDDIPVSLSFKQLKKEKFILSTNLKNDYEVSKKLMLKKKSFRDPRFDPRVNGICTMNDWASLKEDEDSALKVIYCFYIFWKHISLCYILTPIHRSVIHEVVYLVLDT